MAYINNGKVLEIRNALTTVILNADMGVNTDKVIQKQAIRIDRLLPKIKYRKEKCLVYVDKRNQEKKGEKGENR